MYQSANNTLQSETNLTPTFLRLFHYVLEIIFSNIFNQDDQEALIDTQLSMASGSKTDVKSKSRPSSLKISDSNIESEQTDEENRSLGCQVKVIFSMKE